MVPLITTSLNAPEGTAMDFGTTAAVGTPELSPDGKWIVFGARTADNKTPLWIRPLSSSTAQMLAGTDGAIFPFWSPESRYAAFFAGGKLKKIDITGGPPIAIADALNGRGGSWSPGGIILFAPSIDGPLLKIAAGGGTPSPATSIDGTKSFLHRFPWFGFYDTARNRPTRFTFDPGQDRQPVWSPEGTALVWANLSEKGRLRWKSADANGTEEMLYEDTECATRRVGRRMESSCSSTTRRTVWGAESGVCRLHRRNPEVR
jgi:hypothetical protein